MPRDHSLDLAVQDSKFATRLVEPMARVEIDPVEVRARESLQDREIVSDVECAFGVATPALNHSCHLLMWSRVLQFSYDSG
jgi:hypothetical protein